MKYYSEKLNRVFDSDKECLEAEAAAEKAKIQAKLDAERVAREAKEKKEKEAAERKAMAAEVEAARKAMVEAQHAYHEKIDAFIKKYGTYHMTWTDSKDAPTLFDLFDNLFNL